MHTHTERRGRACSAPAALVLLLALAVPAFAQSGEEKAVQTFVEDFLARLGDHKFDTLDADFTPKALIVVARQQPTGGWTNSYLTGEEWLAALKKNPNPMTFREPITNVKVTIDSQQLAHVRADFQVVRDGAVLFSGVDQFTLVRDGSRWKIAVVAYTTIPPSR
ncbi:MAG: hypothetical protein DMF91_02700 [Acidobacteria bacterium]|nr:MAG: hypothetical protein DMF91_02700 [Acidobacteriota bacterium]